jgi:hypothetical protein
MRLQNCTSRRPAPGFRRVIEIRYPHATVIIQALFLSQDELFAIESIVSHRYTALKQRTKELAVRTVRILGVTLLYRNAEVYHIDRRDACSRFKIYSADPKKEPGMLRVRPATEKLAHWKEYEN